MGGQLLSRQQAPPPPTLSTKLADPRERQVSIQLGHQRRRRSCRNDSCQTAFGTPAPDFLSGLTPLAFPKNGFTARQRWCPPRYTAGYSVAPIASSVGTGGTTRRYCYGHNNVGEAICKWPPSLEKPGRGPAAITTPGKERQNASLLFVSGISGPDLTPPTLQYSRKIMKIVSL